MLTAGGKSFRLRRLSRPGDGRYLFVPLDHSVPDGPVTGSDGWAGLIRAIVTGSADAIVVHKGRVRTLTPELLGPCALIVHLSAGTTSRTPCGSARFPVYLLSSQRGGDVLDATEEFKPTAVFAFAGTYGEMAEHDLSQRDLSCVESWHSTGDAAHESHVRALIAQGSFETVGRDLNRHRVAGSVFTDGLGASETGCAIFRNGHKPGSSSYGRCIGKPTSFAEAAVLSEDGKPLPPGEIGRLGVKSPTLTSGYWNDSLTFHWLRLGGFWLTGDLAYRDEDGNFYHLDRAPDAIRTAGGLVFSTRTEELLLREFPGLADCTVVAVAPDGVRADWDGDGIADAYALLQVAQNAPATAPSDDVAWTKAVNEVLAARSFPGLTCALRMDAAEVIKGATGKVLKREIRERFRNRLLAERVARTQA